MKFWIVSKMYARRLCALCFVLACACMWGCGLFDEEVRTSVDDERSDGILVAILDDSLAILKNSRGWEEHAESCDYNSTCDKGSMNQGAFLVNYRKKRSPYWGDTTVGIIHIVNGFAYDSTILFYNDEGKFGFWKIREPMIVRKKMTWPAECGGEMNIQNVRPWKNGHVVLEGVYKCRYAIMDTATGDVKKLEFEGDYAWLEGCDDMAYMGDEIRCLKRLGDAMGTISLLNSEGVIDSLEKLNEDDFLGYPPKLYGQFMITQVYKNGNLVTKVNKDGFDSSYPKTWIKNNAFVDSLGQSIGYSSDDLIVVK